MHARLKSTIRYEMGAEQQKRKRGRPKKIQDMVKMKLLAINEQIPKSAQMPLFTSREHFEQKSLVKHNF